MVGSPTSKETLRGWERKEYGFGIPCQYAKANGKYGFPAGMSVPNYPSIRGIAWYGCVTVRKRPWRRGLACRAVAEGWRLTA